MASIRHITQEDSDGATYFLGHDCERFRPQAGVRYGPALSLLATLFFMWGFITVINNTLLPHLRSVFELNYTQTTLIESVWFIAYFVASIPAAKLIEKIGYKHSIVVGLCIMAAGALGMILAASIPSYGVTLVMLFVIACGITLLQVAANPYVAVVGKPETASSRLNLVQALNSAGTMLAPMFGAWLILGRSKSGTAATGATLTHAERLADAHSVILPYALVAGVLVVLAVVFLRFPLPAMGASAQKDREAQKAKGSFWKRFWHHPLWQHRNLVFGVPAIFIYLIAEIGVANLFVNFVSQPDIANLTHEQAGRYLSFLWGGMMVGRFAGSAIMQKVRAETVLAAFSVGAFIVMMVTVFTTGPVAMWALILVGLFHSIMFPTIFTLGIKGLGP
jgi:FHS family L-fucose permease-like MFS transporter